jgi:hypothetical protein
LQNMDNLAKEKLALEQLLASEKQSLESNNQDLSDQLKKCFHQLKETQALFVREQELNAELEKGRQQLEMEKNALQKSVQEKHEECARLQADLLNLQTNAEKDRKLCEELREQLADSAILTETLQEQLQQAEDARMVAEKEKEEFQSHIMVLTEERDTARAQEEDLFEKLAERTLDLDKLQESYVYLADRCNDAQDENADLRDKIESLQSALESKTFLLSTVNSVSASYNANAHANINTCSVHASVPAANGGSEDYAAAPKGYAVYDYDHSAGSAAGHHNDSSALVSSDTGADVPVSGNVSNLFSSSAPVLSPRPPAGAKSQSQTSPTTPSGTGSGSGSGTSTGGGSSSGASGVRKSAKASQASPRAQMKGTSSGASNSSDRGTSSVPRVRGGYADGDNTSYEEDLHTAPGKTWNGGGDRGSPRKPPPAPAPAAEYENDAYGETTADAADYADDYEEEFEAEED